MTSTDSESVDLDLRFKFDFGDPEIRANPWPYYRALLETPPIMIQKEIPWAYVTRYEDVVKVLHNHEVFSSVRTGLPGTDIHNPFKGVPTMVYSDPPQHTRLRAVVEPSLTKARVDADKPIIRETVDRVLDQYCEGKSEIDGAEDLARQLPMKVLGALRGMSDSEMDETFGLMFASVSSEETIDPSKLGPTIAGMVSKMVEMRGGKTEGKDPISICVAAQQRKEIDDLEFLGLATLSMVAGMLTITETISGALYQMVTRPALLEQIKGDLSLIPRLLEESMRYDPPVHMAMRETTQDTELGGLSIPKNTPVMISFGGANRDPRKFPNPDDFDITRANVRDHLAFGQGIHFCIGHWLGRSVPRIAIERLLERYPRMRLADGFTPVWEGTPVTRGVKHLPILVN